MICEVCSDTHIMTLRDQSVPCTRCPVPCQECRAHGTGAFCRYTPCKCDCHAYTSDEDKLALAHLAGGESPPLRDDTARVFAIQLLERSREVRRLQLEIRTLKGNVERDSYLRLRSAAFTLRIRTDAWMSAGNGKPAQDAKRELDLADTELLLAARSIADTEAHRAIRRFAAARNQKHTVDTDREWHAALDALEEIARGPS